MGQIVWERGVEKNRIWLYPTGRLTAKGADEVRQERKEFLRCMVGRGDVLRSGELFCRKESSGRGHAGKAAWCRADGGDDRCSLKTEKAGTCIKKADAIEGSGNVGRRRADYQRIRYVRAFKFREPEDDLREHSRNRLCFCGAVCRSNAASATERWAQARLQCRKQKASF